MEQALEQAGQKWNKLMAEEANIEKKFKEQVELRGWKAPKFISPGFNGMPDRIVLKDNGQTFFAEIKAPGEEPRPLQLARIEMLRKMGFRVYVIDSMEKAYAVLNIEAKL